MKTHVETEVVPQEPAPVKANSNEWIYALIVLAVLIGFAIWLNYRSRQAEIEQENQNDQQQ